MTHEQDTETTPPDTDHGGGDESAVVVSVTIHDDEAVHTAHREFGATDDETVADAMVSCLRSAAAMRGWSLVVELARRGVQL